MSEVLLIVWVVQMVCLLVRMKIRFLVEPFIARWVRATKWFFASMDPQVGLQVEVKAKLFQTYFALVRFLPCVNEHMPFKLGIVQKSFVAKLKGALKEFVAVDRHVLFETCAVVEDLRT